MYEKMRMIVVKLTLLITEELINRECDKVGIDRDLVLQNIAKVCMMKMIGVI